ncbi:MAG: hypothetical protein ACXW11_04955 [Methylotenera sp.]
MTGRLILAKALLYALVTGYFTSIVTGHGDARYARPFRLGAEG